MFKFKSTEIKAKSTLNPVLSLALPQHEKPRINRLTHLTLCSIITFGGMAFGVNQSVIPAYAQSQIRNETNIIEAHIANIHSTIASLQNRAVSLKSKGETSLYEQNKLISGRFEKLYDSLVILYTNSLNEQISLLSKEEQFIFHEIQRIIKGIDSNEKKGADTIFYMLDKVDNLIYLLPTDNIFPIIIG